MKEIEDMYKTGLLSERAYNEVAKIVGNLQEQYEMDMYKAGKRIGELEAEVDRYRQMSLSEIAAQTRKVYKGQAECIRQLNERISELEKALDLIAGYATIETPQEVTEIINAAKREI